MTTSAPLILICDDEPTIAEIVARYLERAGYETSTAADGEEAVRLAFESRPDLVVLDLMLPRRSGLDVLAEMRGDPRLGDTPVVVITAWSDAQKAALAAGANRFVAKPFEPDELRAIVEELIVPA